MPTESSTSYRNDEINAIFQLYLLDTQIIVARNQIIQICEQRVPNILLFFFNHKNSQFPLKT